MDKLTDQPRVDNDEEECMDCSTTTLDLKKKPPDEGEDEVRFFFFFLLLSYHQCFPWSS